MLGNHAARRNRFCSKDKMLRAAILRSDLQDKLGCRTRHLLARSPDAFLTLLSLHNKTRILAAEDCARHVGDAIKQSAARSIFI